MRRMAIAMVVLVSGLLPLSAAPAFACSCATGGVQQALSDAEHVVVGRLVRTEHGRGKLGPALSGADLAYYTVAGLKVLKGEGVGPRFEVRSSASGASCGLENMVVGRRYAFFMQRDQEGLQAWLCGGTARATPAYLAEIEAVTGPGTSFGQVPPAPNQAEQGALRELVASFSAVSPWR